MAGTFSSSGSSTCTQCSPGYFNTANKSSGWDPWIAGKYNTVPGSTTCDVWDDGYTSNPGSTSWFAIWGDSKRKIGEQWDDGNTTNGDGWDSTCQLETGYKCKTFMWVL